MELWKPIVGYEDFYEVSNLGRVRSFHGKGRILKQQPIRTGYLIVWLYNGKPHGNGRCGKAYQVHRLVADAFLPNPNCLPEVNHINENKNDNRAENLEWCSHAYNSSYGTRGKKIGAKLKNGKRSTPIDQFDLSGNYIETFPSWAELRRCGYSPQNIWMQMQGKRNHAYGYKWRYAEDFHPNV